MYISETVPPGNNAGFYCWREFQIDLHDLCDDDYDKDLLIRWHSIDEAGTHTVVQNCYTTINLLQS